MQSLSAFLLPASIAVVGAGDRPTSSGGAVLRNLVKSRYAGRIVPVNPKGGELLGLPVAASLRGVTPPCELAVIVVRPDAILDVVQEAAETGHRNLLILPGGFAEGGAEGQSRDQALRALAAAHDLRIAGPNCAGLINLLDGDRPYAATFFRDLPRGGGVALISQSGAIAEEAIAASHAAGVPLGAIVSVGNAMQLGVLEYLRSLGDDPTCKVVLLYAETFGDEARFGEVARAVAQRKPVVALIGGRTQPGREAARRHTGSAAPTDAQAAAFCREAGLLRVTSLRELLLAGKALAAHPAGIGRRVLLLSNSGGPGVLCADRCADGGLALPVLPVQLEQRLRGFFPPEAVAANPLDLLADAREDRFGATLEAVLQDAAGAYDAILMLHVVPFMVDPHPVVARLAALARGAQVPILHSMMGTLDGRQDWMGRLEAVGVPLFDNVEDMAMAATLLAAHRETRRQAQGEPQ